MPALNFLAMSVVAAPLRASAAALFSMPEDLEKFDSAITDAVKGKAAVYVLSMSGVRANLPVNVTLAARFQLE